MSLYDPSESKFARIFRWIFWGLVIVGGLLWGLASNPDGLWEMFKYGFIYLGIYIGVQTLIIEPLNARIAALEYKIDTLIRRLG